MNDIVISYKQEEFDALLPLIGSFQGFTRNYDMSLTDDQKWAFLGLYAEAKLKQYLNHDTEPKIEIGHGDGGIDLKLENTYQILTRILKTNSDKKKWEKFLVYDEDLNTTADMFLFLLVNPFECKIIYMGCIPTNTKFKKNHKNYVVEFKELDKIDIEHQYDKYHFFNNQEDIEYIEKYRPTKSSKNYEIICEQRERYGLPKISEAEYNNILASDCGKQLVYELISTPGWTIEEEARVKKSEIKTMIREMYKIDNYEKHMISDYAELIYNKKITLDELGEKYGLSKKIS